MKMRGIGIVILMIVSLLVGCGQADETKKDMGYKVKSTETAMGEQMSLTFRTPERDQPTLKLSVKTVKGSAEIRLITENFTFAPEKTNQKPLYGEGHAHLWLNGEVKHLTVTGQEVKLSGLAPGEYEVKVALHHNNHQPYEVEERILFKIVD
jgi:hypothetical protein